MATVYRNGSYRAINCPKCSQEVRVDRRGDEFLFSCRGGCSDEDLRPLLPPKVMLELAEGTPSANGASANPGPTWPAAIGDAGLIGLAGQVVNAIEPHTEADPAACLVQFLTHVGNACGRNPRFVVESTDHHLNLFCVIAGPTAAGRKGSSYRQSRKPLELTGADLGTTASGLSSGEGLIAAVRDPTFKRRKPKKGEEPDEDGYVVEVEDEGVLDKRLVVFESEFAAVISRMGRQGNVLSSVLRQAWDGETLSTLTKGSPAKASGAHVSMIAHVTGEELRRELSAVDAASGFANRFLWVCAQRSKLLPHGGGEIDWKPVANPVRDVLSFATSGQLGAIPLDLEATARWEAVYEALTAGDAAPVGTVTSRAEAQVRRLATVYAVLDRSSEVRLEHLEAGLEVWRYCRESAVYLFGHGSGDPVADQILDGLRTAGPKGLTRTETSNLLGRNQPKARITQALTVLLINDMARLDRDGQTERWIAQ